jgi:predicted secreted protein
LVVGLILLTVLLLCSDRRLVIFYSYAISLLVIYFYHQINRFANINMNMFILQFLLSCICIQMLNIRSHVYTYKLQIRCCYFAPFIFLITRYLLPFNIFYLCWMFIHFSELVIYQRNMIFYLIRNRFLSELINFYDNFGLQTLLAYLQQHIHIVILLKIFWLTKIIVLPLGIRTIYANPFIINSTTKTDINITNTTDMVYNETLIKTIYFTSIFYGTETIFT